MKRLSQSAIKRPWPIAASACDEEAGSSQLELSVAEVAASSRSSHLLDAQILPSTAHRHPLETDGDSTRADEHYAVAHGPETTYRLDNAREQRQQRLVGVGIDDGGRAELDDNRQGGGGAEMSGIPHGVVVGGQAEPEIDLAFSDSQEEKETRGGSTL